MCHESFVSSALAWLPLTLPVHFAIFNPTPHQPLITPIGPLHVICHTPKCMLVTDPSHESVLMHACMFDIFQCMPSSGCTRFFNLFFANFSNPSFLARHCLKKHFISKGSSLNSIAGSAQVLFTLLSFELLVVGVHRFTTQYVSPISHFQFLISPESACLLDISSHSSIPLQLYRLANKENNPHRFPLLLLTYDVQLM